MDIKKVVIVGSGTMGSGIAAQVANAGIPVLLLDLPSNEGSKNQIVENHYLNLGFKKEEKLFSLKVKDYQKKINYIEIKK